MASPRLWLLVIASSLTAANDQLVIKLEQNGYRNVLIAISDTVDYDSKLVPRIKEVFNNASAMLFKATHFRAYFKEVTILVPKGWNVPEAERATFHTFEKAHVRVENMGSDTPYVWRLPECGVQHGYMHLTPKYLLNEAYALKHFGPPGKTIVHEWSHLRWGVFDEYPTEESRPFYLSTTTKRIEATRCNINVVGTIINRKTKRAGCKPDTTKLLPKSKCRFHPNKNQTKALSSLMSHTYLPSVVEFCDDDETKVNIVHNYEAPNNQNIHCKYKSAWAVMRETPDFKNGRNKPVKNVNQNTDITFTVVQHGESKVVVIMDVSGSMNDDNRHIKMNTAVKRYLRNTVPTGTSVGLVKYSSFATGLTIGLVKINNETDRQRLANLVPLEADGGTAIGKGLLRAKQMLESASATPENIKGSRIILLTDGEENVAPYMSSVLPSLLSAGVTVDTLSLTSQASSDFTNLAAQTGGQHFYASGGDDSTSLNDAFTESERSRISNPRDLPITIESRVVSVEVRKNLCHNVVIDKSLGRDTTFTFSWVTATTDISIEISNEDVKRLATVETTNRAAAYRCEGQCMTGSWKVCIQNSQSIVENVVFQVESTAKQTNSTNGELLPITVKSYILNKEPDFNNSQNYKPVFLFASVTRGYAPVVGAMVVANIEYPSSDKNNTYLLMRDDGAGADMVEGDGTYSAYIVNSVEKGKHTISINVNGDNKTSIKIVDGYQGGAAVISEPGEPIVSQEVKFTPTGEFQRFSPAGYIDVQSVAPPDVDFFPPSRIIDLKVTETSYDDGTITFEWTAVGDDLDEGSASSYELWTSDSFKTMIRNRTGGATKIPASRVVEGNLSSPLPAYSKEKLVINVPDKDTIFVYALVAEDDANNPSELSNVISAKLVKVPEESPKGDSTNIGLIVGIVVGVVAFITIMVAVVVVVKKRRRQSSIV